MSVHIFLCCIVLTVTIITKQGKDLDLLSKHWIVLSLYLEYHLPQSHTDTDVSRSPPPKLPDLMNYVAARVPDKWRTIGIQLGLSQADLTCIHTRSDGDSNTCFTEVFTIWERRMDPPYSWKTIIEVLRCECVYELRVAEEIRSKFIH